MDGYHRGMGTAPRVHGHVAGARAPGVPPPVPSALPVQPRPAEDLAAMISFAGYASGASFGAGRVRPRWPLPHRFADRRNDPWPREPRATRAHLLWWLGRLSSTGRRTAAQLRPHWRPLKPGVPLCRRGEADATSPIVRLCERNGSRSLVPRGFMVPLIARGT